MRLRVLSGLLALGVVTCGGEKESGAPGSPPQPASAPAGTAAAGPMVEVKMTRNGATQVAFEPSVLRIEPGTTVRFINVSGGTHNITFYPDSIPDGAAAALKAGMPNLMGDLTGPFLTTSNETYDVSFARAPTGTYKGYCMLHAALGMKITIEVG